MPLWTPETKTPMEIDSQMVDLHDSDILAFKNGPIAWVRKHEGQRRDIDRFTKDLAEQFHQIGFGVEVQVWDTNVRGAYIFKVVIQKRIDSTFDPDRQVSEVVNNLLELPGETKGHVINTGKSMQEFERERKERVQDGRHNHSHLN